VNAGGNAPEWAAPAASPTLDTVYNQNGNTVTFDDAGGRVVFNLDNATAGDGFDIFSSNGGADYMSWTSAGADALGVEARVTTFDIQGSGIMTLLGSAINMTGLVTLNNGGNVVDGQTLSFGAGTDLDIGSDGANSTITANNGNFTLDNIFATGFNNFYSGTDTNLTGHRFYSNSNLILSILGNSTVAFSVGNENSAFTITDGDGDNILKFSPGADNNVDILNAVDNGSFRVLSQATHHFGSTSEHTDDSTTNIVVGLMSYDQFGGRFGVENNSGIAISEGDLVYISGDWEVTANPTLNDFDNRASFIAASDFAAGAGSKGYVRAFGIQKTKSNSVLGFTAKDAAFGDDSGGVVLGSEIDVADVVQPMGSAMAAEAAGFVYLYIFPAMVTE
jgi:hypothetical protein